MTDITTHLKQQHNQKKAARLAMFDKEMSQMATELAAAVIAQAYEKVVSEDADTYRFIDDKIPFGRYWGDRKKLRAFLLNNNMVEVWLSDWIDDSAALKKYYKKGTCYNGDPVENIIEHILWQFVKDELFEQGLRAEVPSLEWPRNSQGYLCADRVNMVWSDNAHILIQ